MNSFQLFLLQDISLSQICDFKLNFILNSDLIFKPKWRYFLLVYPLCDCVRGWGRKLSGFIKNRKPPNPILIACVLYITCTHTTHKTTYSTQICNMWHICSYFKSDGSILSIVIIYGNDIYVIIFIYAHLIKTIYAQNYKCVGVSCIYLILRYNINIYWWSESIYCATLIRQCGDAVVSTFLTHTEFTVFKSKLGRKDRHVCLLTK